MESADPSVLHLTVSDCYRFHYSKHDPGRNSLDQVVELTKYPTAGLTPGTYERLFPEL